MNEKISVIIPIYNIEKYLCECVESVLNQTYKNLEIILVDDGSIDASPQICDTYVKKDERVKVFHQENKGVVLARKKGLENATGEYVSFIDADDWIDENMYVEMLDKGSDCDLISAGYYREYYNSEAERRIDLFNEGIYETNLEIEHILKNMIYWEGGTEKSFCIPSMCNKLFKRELATSVYEGMNTEMIWAEDEAFIFKYLLRCNRVCIVHSLFYHYRMRADSAMHSLNKNFLCAVNWLYLELEEAFSNHRNASILIPQLERLIIESIDDGVVRFMGFKTAKLQYRVPFLNKLENKKIVLYGAGKVGKDYFKQLQTINCDLLAWIDRNYENCKEEIPITDISIVKNIDYDYIIIAVKRKSLADVIRAQMKELDIPDSKIFWEEPN